jgi:radical SAM protein with 4Fe4S-binding SPASM domain
MKSTQGHNAAYSRVKSIVSTELERLAFDCSLLEIPRSTVLPPSIVQIETTTKCNLRCKMCLRTYQDTCFNKDMSLEIFRKAINQSVCSRLIKPIIILTGLGEPLLNPNIDCMVFYAKNKGLETQMTSNFTVVNQKILENFVKAQLDILCISVDAASPAAFERIRIGAKFEDVMNNVKMLLQIRKSMNSVKPRILFRSTINANNVNEIPEITKLARTIGVDGAFFTNQINPNEESLNQEPNVKPTSKKLLSKQNSNVLKEKNVCQAMRKCYITFDGKVLPCNYLIEIIPREKYWQFEFGDISHDTLRNIWLSTRYKQFRVRMASGYHPCFCSNCPIRLARASS